MAPDPYTPVVVTCHLCQPECPIVTISSMAWETAMNHGLDDHRDAFLTDGEQACLAFTINTTGRPLPLRAPVREGAL